MNQTTAPDPNHPVIDGLRELVAWLVEKWTALVAVFQRIEARVDGLELKALCLVGGACLVVVAAMFAAAWWHARLLRKTP